MTPIIWIIDVQQWPRAYLRAELLERGYEAIGFMELADALTALCSPVHEPPALMILELRDLNPTAAEIVVLRGIRIPMIALGGTVELHAEWVKTFPWATVLRRPVAIGEVADLVEKLIAGSEEK